MSKLIAQLLQADPRSFAQTIARLESMCLQPGVDTKLTTEIIVQSREKVRKLDLDPTDSTREELYYSLLAQARKDDELLRNKMGIHSAGSSSKTAEIIETHVNPLLKKDTVICMVPPTIKKILKAVPPKRTLRLLRFRSIESVLKREDPCVLYALATILEDTSWHSQVQARIKRLQPREAGETSVRALSIPNSWYDKLATVQFESIIKPVPEVGIVLLLPTIPLSVAGSVLLTVCLIMQASQRLAIESLPFRNRALTIGYEKLLPDITVGVVGELDTVHGLRPSWHAVFQLLAERDQVASSVSDFEFLLGDLEWQSVESRLVVLEPTLNFWLQSHMLGYYAEDRPISMHVVDVAANLVLDKKYGNQVFSHLQSSLWNELQLRYLRQDNIERAIVSQLTMTQEIVL